jgi:N-acylglucosamine 2-epimerase
MVSRIPRARAQQLLRHYRTALFDDVEPWWRAHLLDREQGGYHSCLDRSGAPYAGDKFLWPTARAIWMLSHLYNEQEARPDWLAAAKAGVDWMVRGAFAGNGRMYFRLTRDGRPLARSLSLFTESFAIIALAEYAKVSGERPLLDRALAMCASVLERLGKPSDTAQLGYPLETSFHLHGHDMMRLTAAWVLKQVTADARWNEAIDLSIESVRSRHWKPALDALLENVALSGEAMLDLPEGRMVMPGHAAETAWMMMEVARERGDEGLMQECRGIVLASLERGWDREYGGLRYIVNIDGSPPHPLEGDLKLWWPHCEALYALLLLWDHYGDSEIASWYARVHDYTFDLYPDRELGEWIGYRNREGSPVFTAKANGWKGFFHLPRFLFRGCRLLQTAAGVQD